MRPLKVYYERKMYLPDVPEFRISPVLWVTWKTFLQKDCMYINVYNNVSYDS